ncbi:MAG: toll/interleukin-1 receptor domain-containing protein [Acidobacteria bacterium]|nr:toll/interleukin-1 receptor domain-containing protein [Acidobacteriota bacterium]
MTGSVGPVFFLTYCAKDSKAARDLVTFMRSLGITLKFDEEILLPANPISDRLRDEIERCDGCVWLLTENSLASRWCLVEAGVFWGAKKPVIIYNPFALDYDGPFKDLKQARSLDDIKRSLEGLKVQSKPLAAVTIEEASQILEKGLTSLAQSVSQELSVFRDRLPALDHIAEYLEVQDNFLSNHAQVLRKITRMIERAPQKVRWAFDVPSFGSISAEREYRICCDAIDMYIAKEEWDITIMLLPADVGVSIVNTEFSELKKRRQAWVEDIQALHRFQGYQQRAGQRGNRKFQIGWLAVNRDSNGVPLGLHSMPLNIWIANDDEAVFSTVIDNYRPTGTSSPTEGSQVQEIGFSTRNPRMVRFLSEIMEKYAQNIDESIKLDDQIAVSEKVKLRIERSM